MRCSYRKCSKYIENLFVVDFILRDFVDRLLSEDITLDEFYREFAEEVGIDKKLLEARKILGVGEDEEDMEEIDRSYKKLARKYHPDMSGGDEVLFKQINDTHKLIRKELE